MINPLYVLVALVPVGLFLGALVALDSYKLLRLRTVLTALGAGGLAAVLAFVLNSSVAEAASLTQQVLSRYVAPGIEEVLKAAFVIWLVFRDRVGFSVDSAIAGFAVGAGFAAIENIYFLGVMSHAGLDIWIVRGVGTAIMHGTTTAVCAIVIRTLWHGDGASSTVAVPAGVGVAYVLHAAYNHFPFGVFEGALFLVITAPALLAIVFVRSEKHTEQWLGTGFDTDQELLDLLMSGRISDTRIGSYLLSLKEHFEPAVVADMLCLIRIRVELSLRAKGVLMMREAGLEPLPDPTVPAKFAEMKYLEESIGTTGLLAIKPTHTWSKRELWQLNLIED